MTVFTAQPAGAAGIDTYFWKAYPTTTDGTNTTIDLNKDTDYQQNGLIKFDVSSIGAGVTVNSATLSLYADIDALDWIEHYLRAYSILAANDGWTEGGACWNYKTGTTAWAGGASGCQSSGTDYNATLLGQCRLDNPRITAGGEIAIPCDTTQIAAWINGQNYGALLMMSGFYINLRSSDHATAATRPKLTIDYTAAAVPSLVIPNPIRRYQHLLVR